MATNTNITLSKIPHRAMDVNVLSKALVHTTNTSVTIKATSTTVLVANTSRKCATFVNDSDEVIYLTLSEDGAILNKGIRLNANGGSYEINVTNLYNGAITAICTSGSKNLCVTEGYDKVKGRVTITADGWVGEVQSATINSDLFLGWLGLSKTINSNGWVMEVQSATTTSDNHIKQIYTKTVTSNMFLGYLGQTKTIDSNAKIKNLGTEGSITQNAKIKKLTAKTINSNTTLGYLGQTKTITSNLFIGYYQVESIWCRLVITE